MRRDAALVAKRQSELQIEKPYAFFSFELGPCGSRKSTIRIQLVDPGFDQRTGNHECVPALQPFDRLGGFRAPVFDSLRLVQNHDVRVKEQVHFKRITHDLFVIDDRKKRRMLQRSEPFSVRTEDQPIRKPRETLNLFLPLYS